MTILCLALLGVFTFGFVVVRPPLGKMYCQNKVDRLQSEIREYIEKAKVEEGEAFSYSEWSKITKNLTDEVYGKCLHRWGV